MKGCTLASFRMYIYRDVYIEKESVKINLNEPGKQMLERKNSKQWAKH